MFLTYMGILPLTLLSTSGNINEDTLVLYKAAYIFISFFLINLKLTFLLPTIKNSYKSYFVIILIVIHDISMGLINFFTIDVRLEGEYIRQEAAPIGGLLWILSIMVFMIIAFYRIRDTRKLNEKSKNVLFSMKAIVVYAVLFNLAPFIEMAIASNPSSNIPLMIENLPVSLVLVIFIITIYKGEKTLFLIPEKIYGVIVTEQETGITAFGHNFTEDAHADEIIGGLFTALNISLQDAIQTNSNMNDLIFGDRAIIISPGSSFTTLLITSKKTLMTTYLSNQINKEFEKRFLSKLKTFINGQIPNEVSEFTEFTQDISDYFAYT